MFPHWLAWLLGTPMLTIIGFKVFNKGREHAARRRS